MATPQTCPRCLALTVDLKGHITWHDKLTKKLSILSAALGEPDRINKRKMPPVHEFVDPPSERSKARERVKKPKSTRDLRVHITQVFDELEPGTMLTIAEICGTVTEEYPAGGIRPSGGSVYQRLRDCDIPGIIFVNTDDAKHAYNKSARGAAKVEVD